MRTFYQFFLVGALLVCLQCVQADASDVYLKVDENETGQGIFRQRNTECLLITPAHVVEDAFTLEATTADRSKYPAELIELFPGDISILRLKTDDHVACRQTIWPSREQLNALLGTEQQGELHSMLADGSIRKIPVEVIGYDKYRNINIRPVNQEDALSKGASGSPLYLAGQVAGMLLSITNGVGNVIRQDALANAIALFFDEGNQDGGEKPTALGADPAPGKSAPKIAAPHNDSSFTGTILTNVTKEHAISLTANSPIQITLAPTGDKVRYAVELIDSTNRVSCSRSLKSPLLDAEVSFPCTPLATDKYALRVTGTGGEGAYKIAFSPITSDAALRNDKNIISVDGDAQSETIVKNAVAEYKVKLYHNSPVRIVQSLHGDDYKYTTEISDSTGKIVFRNLCAPRPDQAPITTPFTPPTTDAYVLRVLGTEGAGQYSLALQSIAFDAQLRGEANLLKIGGSAASGVIAKDAVAEYRFDLDANVPVRFNFPATGDQGAYNVKVLDSTGSPVYSDPYKRIRGQETSFIPFTASKADQYTLRLIGTEGECRYAVSLTSK